MARLIFTVNASLDGFIEDADGRFDWSMPEEEFHRTINDLERPVGTYVYGRRMYETMVYWETNPHGEAPDYINEYAGIWRAADKVVISRTLTAPTSARTRIEAAFDASTLRQFVDGADRDVSISGPDLAGQAIRAGIVDELRLFTWPVVLGGGKPWLPTGVHLDLELADVHRLASGVVYTSYRVPRGTT